MKKQIIAGFIFLTSVLLCGCSENGNTSRAYLNPPDEIHEKKEAADVSQTELGTAEGQEAQLKLVCPSTGSGNENGFYYLRGEEQTNAEGKYYINIRYIDYASEQDIILCNKPNCKHDNADCTSYIEALWSHDAILITGDTKLFLICNPYSMTTFSADGDVTLSENAPTIYTMNLDGSDRKKIVSLESGYELQASEYLVKGEKLYLVASKSEIKTQGDETRAMRTGQELVEVDAQKKTTRTVCEFLNQNIVGVWNQSIIVRKCNYEKNPDEMTDSEFQAAVQNLGVTIYTLDMETGAMETCFDTDYKSTENLGTANGKIYFGKYKNPVLSCYDLATKETAVVTEALPAGSIEIIDGKIIVNCDDGASFNAEYTESYAVDIQSGEVTKRDLVIRKPFSPVDILADAGTDYLVVSDCIYEEEMTWAGTEQINIIKQIKSLITKEDFWQCNPNYRTITEIGGAEDHDGD